MEKTVRLIFTGDLQPGRSLDEVKAGLPIVMKIPPEQVEKLFGGQRVVIKRGLPESKLPAYQALLLKAGLLAAVEEEAPVVPTLDLAPMTVPVPQASVAPISEEMDCPQCGVRQPKRTLCKQCGVDMPRFTAAQATLKAEAANPKPVITQSAYAASSSMSWDEDMPPIFGLSFEGRLNRLRYFIYGLAMQAVMILMSTVLIGGVIKSAVTGSFPVFSVVIFMALVLVMAFFGFRYSAHRLHDMGHTGWLVLLTFVPMVGVFAWLWMAIWPGDKDSNQYGPPNPPNETLHKMIALGLVLLVVILLGLMVKKAMRATADLATQIAPQMQQMPRQGLGAQEEGRM